jgi:hypothetical protein
MSSPQDQPEAASSPTPLSRPTPTLWRRLGGEGLALSILVHAVLVVIAVIWVVSTVTDTSGKKDPNAFATGSGGGSGGPRAKEFRTKAVPKNVKSLAKSNTRITSKNTNSAMAISSLPSLSNPMLSAGAIGGGSSKGFGGGSGGGIGAGKGTGVGGGRNFVSLFGMKGIGVNYGVVGNFYDFKQTRGGKPSEMFGSPDSTNFRDPANTKPNSLYAKEVKEFLVDKNWVSSALSDKFRAPDSLYASQIFIPQSPATICPKAYGVEKSVKPSRWLAHYKGTVKVPQSGKVRFVGSGDDILVVRWGRKVALDSGYYQPVVGNSNIYKDFEGVKCDETHRSNLGKPLRCGPWIQMTAGAEVPIEIAFGEMPGGSFYGVLCIEVMGPDGKGTGMKLLRFSTQELPKEIQDPRAIGAKIDMQARGWIFTPVKGRL